MVASSDVLSGGYWAEPKYTIVSSSIAYVPVPRVNSFCLVNWKLCAPRRRCESVVDGRRRDRGEYYRVRGEHRSGWIAVSTSLQRLTTPRWPTGCRAGRAAACSPGRGRRRMGPTIATPTTRSAASAIAARAAAHPAPPDQPMTLNRSISRRSATATRSRAPSASVWPRRGSEPPYPGRPTATRWTPAREVPCGSGQNKRE